MSNVIREKLLAEGDMRAVPAETNLFMISETASWKKVSRRMKKQEGGVTSGEKEKRSFFFVSSNCSFPQEAPAQQKRLRRAPPESQKCENMVKICVCFSFHAQRLATSTIGND